MAKAVTHAANDTIQELASGVMAVGAAVSVETSEDTRVFVDYAPTSETAVTVGTYPRAIVQLSPVASGDEFWYTYNEFQFSTTTAASEALQNTEAVGATVMEVASTSGVQTPGMGLFFKNATLANSQWAVLKSYAATPSITIEAGLTREQPTGTVVYTQAERKSCPLPYGGFKRYRVLMFAPTGPTCVFQTSHATTAV